MYAIPSIALLIAPVLIAALPQSQLATQHASPNAMQLVARHTLQNATQNAVPTAVQGRNHIIYLGSAYTAQAYSTQKEQELNELRTRLADRYHVTFRTRATTFFNIAYRGADASAEQLVTYLEAFYRDIFPRYFGGELQHVVSVVYFASQKEFYDQTGSDTYGYYQSAERTMYTYVGSGYGTLWHEMVHAFLDDASGCDLPEWFSEGLASFYEMASLSNGHIVEGYANWRLPALQSAITDKSFTPLAAFVQKKSFDDGLGYAEARFLFCYLWVQRQLVPFVHSYLADVCPSHHGADEAQAAIALMEQLVGKDMSAINDDYVHLAQHSKRNQKLNQR
jgi:hypothetical protein